jgi:hypothetical protein
MVMGALYEVKEKKRKEMGVMSELEIIVNNTNISS